MIYSASEPIPPFSKVDISFPHQVEIKVNLDDVKANLRGLKNKPGTTRPADVTQLLRKKGTYENSLTVTYALTNKVSNSQSPTINKSCLDLVLACLTTLYKNSNRAQKFYLVVNLVKQHRVEDLVSKLKSGRMISKDRVIRESNYCNSSI